VTSSATRLFDSPGAISYRCSIVSESISPAIFEIMGPKHYWGHELDLSGSRDVIGHVINPSAICHFLLVSYWNRVSISNRIRDIRPQCPCARTHTDRFYILSHAMYCIGQTTRLWQWDFYVIATHATSPQTQARWVFFENKPYIFWL